MRAWLGKLDSPRRGKEKKQGASDSPILNPPWHDSSLKKQKAKLVGTSQEERTSVKSLPKALEPPVLLGCHMAPSMIKPHFQGEGVGCYEAAGRDLEKAGKADIPHLQPIATSFRLGPVPLAQATFSNSCYYHVSSPLWHSSICLFLLPSLSEHVNYHFLAALGK